MPKDRSEKRLRQMADFCWKKFQKGGKLAIKWYKMFEKLVVEVAKKTMRHKPPGPSL